jgi:hypothetical protein
VRELVLTGFENYVSEFQCTCSRCPVDDTNNRVYFSSVVALFGRCWRQWLRCKEVRYSDVVWRVDGSSSTGVKC